MIVTCIRCTESAGKIVLFSWKESCIIVPVSRTYTYHQHIKVTEDALCPQIIMTHIDSLLKEMSLQ